MEYDVSIVAAELMLTKEELREVLDIYFQDAKELVADCYCANQRKDYSEIAQRIHALKGSSLNLRMDNIADMALEIEQLASQTRRDIADDLSRVERAIIGLEKNIYGFYEGIGNV